MVARTLQEARVERGVSVARLAELARTSRAAITDYEAGRKQPQLDTASRLLDALGDQLVIVRAPAKKRSRVDADALAPFEQWPADRDRALAAATRDLSLIIDADAALERLDIRWAQVKVIGDGVTVDGDPISVYRVQDLWADAKALLASVRRGKTPKLQVIAGDQIITADTDGSVPRQAFGFLAKATAAGADAAKMRHLTGAYLTAHGYPWPWVLHSLASEYGRAYVACRRFEDGTPLTRVLAQSLEKVSW